MRIEVIFENEKNTLKVGLGNKTYYEISKRGTKPFTVVSKFGHHDVVEEAGNTKTISLKNGEKIELGINITPSDIEKIEVVKIEECILLKIKENLAYEIPLETTWSVREATLETEEEEVKE